MQIKADLHVHSRVSDCSYTREEILEMAVREKLTHLSFTEHDTTLQSDEVALLSEKSGIQLLKGIEISAYDFSTGKKAHILGYNYKTTNNLETLCRPTLEKRHQNCVKQIGILKELGYKIEVEDILPYAPAGTIYKQHILDYLLKTKQSEMMFGRIYKEIFKNQGPCDFDITYVSAQDAVGAIVADGGVAVLAHPMQQNNLHLVSELVRMGLQGIECNHNSTKDRKCEIIECAKEYGLFLTGGSDFHGEYESASSPLGGYLSYPEFVEYLESEFLL